MSDDEAELSLDQIFTEPSRPPTPEPTIAIYERDNSRKKFDEWETIQIRLVGTHPLWGHHLWNASRAFASYLDEHKELYYGRSVLELGAGGGLPSIVAAKNGAQKIVITDYPDDDLVSNMAYNVETNIPVEHRDGVSVLGYTWGRPVEPLFKTLDRTQGQSSGFDLIILSDLIFNHSQHDALLTTCEMALSLAHVVTASPPPLVLVFYTHHRPHLAHRDMEFFTKAHERGWICDEILTKMFPPMFPKDPGEEAIRSTVHGWRLLRHRP